MVELREFKCPNCDGAIKFDSSIQKMKCPYCEAEIEVDALEQYEEALNSQGDDEINWQSMAGTQWNEGESDGLVHYVCQSCGGEVIGDENLAATKCPYCDNPIVILGKFEGNLKPDIIIPFKLDKETAVKSLKKHLEGKRLLPKVFKDENHIEEIKGVYVPFWIFDYRVDAKVDMESSRLVSWSDRRYIYTQTNYFHNHREGEISFTNVPIDGSKKMDDFLMQSIEPFDVSEAVEFKTPYLAGYYAEKYDLDREEGADYVNNRIKNSVESVFVNNVQLDYGDPRVINSSFRFNDAKARYALYPVWILLTKWQGEQYVFAMNGQTGKFTGNLPEDRGLLIKYWIILTIIFGLAIYLLLALYYWIR